MGCQRGRRITELNKLLIINLINEASKQDCRIKVACADVGIDIKTLQRWRGSPEDKRKGPISTPANKLNDTVKKEILETATSKEFCDDSPWVIVAKLADQGIYLASESSFYKVLKEQKLLAHRGKSKPPTKKRPTPLIASGPNQIWSWDITYLKSSIRGQYYYLYLFMDIFSRKIVGFNIFEKESMEHSSLLIENICIKENIQKDQLTLHSDNGGPMKGATMLATLQKLGVAPSFSRPRVSDDNPYSESLFKTVKYNPSYPDVFDSLDKAKTWVQSFVSWYNEEHLHSGIKFVTPKSRHEGLDKSILLKRKEVYETAKAKHPERWGNKKIKNFSHINKVHLNYLQKNKDNDIKTAS